jgi:hypothetical protein
MDTWPEDSFGTNVSVSHALLSEHVVEGMKKPGACAPGLATPTGLEPATSAVTGRRANQLRYGASW